MNEMKPCDFGAELTHLLKEYRQSGTFEQVPFFADEADSRVGVAAGPQTQTAAGIVSCWAAGACTIELKTVQILSGKSLNLQKPGIAAGDRVYNTEMSSEFSADTAAAEYISAWLLIRVLAREFSLKRLPVFVASVGFDLKGIRTKAVTDFLSAMKNPAAHAAFKHDIKYLRKHLRVFEHITARDIDRMEAEACVADSVTINTKPGCPKEEMEAIGEYLLSLGFSLGLKLNPTIIGRENVYKLLKAHGYEDKVDESAFENEPGMNVAVDLIGSLMQKAEEKGLGFCVRISDTLPVKIQNNELPGEIMYLSGKAIYPLALMAAGLIAATCPGVPISFSGGADRWNVGNLLYAGVSTVLVCSILLKPGGFKNLYPLVEAARSVPVTKCPNQMLLHELSERTQTDSHYDAVTRPRQERLPGFSPTCAFCENCVDVCPNRANIRIRRDDAFAVVHVEDRCNRCGACVSACRLGHEPCQEKEVWKGELPEGV